ncbi:hypothetical protein [Tessaracoccus coleopterorum]|uniref:hypothetical protein n=1 Tax=Tessaracoccus coleopterorum TaxID=2714950 RepID=UPI0038CD4C6C
MSRRLAALAASGAIELTGRRKVRILDPDALEGRPPLADRNFPTELAALTS